MRKSHQFLHRHQFRTGDIVERRKSAVLTRGKVASVDADGGSAKMKWETGIGLAGKVTTEPGPTFGRVDIATTQGAALSEDVLAAAALQNTRVVYANSCGVAFCRALHLL